MQTVGEIVRKQEQEFRRGTVQKSRYVTYSHMDTIDRIDAYLNSKHISGETDSLGREKPFFNIVTSVTNIYFRAIDLDTKNLKFRSDSSKHWLNAIIAKIFVRKWMRKHEYAQFLNEWARVQSRYNSAIVKAVVNSNGVHLSVTPWQRQICDAVEYEPNPKIDVIELTEGQLRERITTHGYWKDAVEALIDAAQDRETLDRQRKDNKPDYIKLYEMHAYISREQLLHAQNKPTTDADKNIFQQAVTVQSFVGKKTPGGRRSTVNYDDFIVYAGEEETDPNTLTHLLKEDGRTLAIGPVEHLFTAQWMENHYRKNEKDTLDLASKIIFQTSDPTLVGQNFLDNMETGDILLHAVNAPLTKVDNSKIDLQLVGNAGSTWKQLAQEISGISEAMLGITPPSGTPAAQTNAILRENYWLFETYRENRGLDVIKQMRNVILPNIKKTMLDHSDEIGAELEEEDIQRIDAVYLQNEAIERTNAHVLSAISANLDATGAVKKVTRIKAKKPIEPINVGGLMQQNTTDIQNSLKMMGNQRFFKPSDITKAMWKDQLEDFEWDMEISVTDEETDVQAMAGALTQALTLVMQPGYDQNEDAKMIVRKIFAFAGAVSPLSISQKSPAPIPQPIGAPGAGAPNRPPTLSTGGGA